MSPNTERLSLTAAVLVATLAWPCLQGAAGALHCRVALGDGVERIARVRAVWSRALIPAGYDTGRPRAHRTAIKLPGPSVAAARQT